MKISPFLLILFCIQCGSPSEDVAIEPRVDTVYVEKEAPLQPWELSCYDEAETNLEINVCSRECLNVADSLFDLQYDKLMKRLDKGISESYIPEFHEDLKRQKRRVRSLNRAFSELEIALSRLVDHSIGDARMHPLISNSYLLDLKIYQIETFTALEEEVIHNF